MRSLSSIKRSEGQRADDPRVQGGESSEVVRGDGAGDDPSQEAGMSMIIRWVVWLRLLTR
jgi:hypothetical protein